MTHNQKRAIALAGDIHHGRIDAGQLPDVDWDLLLLAAEMNKRLAPPMLIASRVLERATRHLGYFSEVPPAGSNVSLRVRLRSELIVNIGESPTSELDLPCRNGAGRMPTFRRPKGCNNSSDARDGPGSAIAHAIADLDGSSNQNADVTTPPSGTNPRDWKPSSRGIDARKCADRAMWLRSVAPVDGGP